MVVSLSALSKYLVIFVIFGICFMAIQPPTNAAKNLFFAKFTGATGTPTATPTPTPTGSGSPTPTATPTATPTGIQALDEVPLTDGCGTNYQTGSLSIPKCLYANGSNLAPGTAHSAAALSHIANIQKLDTNGNPSSSGKIGVGQIGMSISTDVSCGYALIRGLAPSPCEPESFIGESIAGQSSGLVNPNLTFADFAQYSQGPAAWALPRNAACDSGAAGSVTNCTSPWDTAIGNGIAGGVPNRLTQFGLSANQIQVLFILIADQVHVTGELPLANLGHAWPCTAADTSIYACVNETEMGATLRNIKTYFPNIQVVYLVDVSYGGFDVASITANDPTQGLLPDQTFNGIKYAYGYEWGLTNQHIESCQESQADLGGGACNSTGSLAYSVAPLILEGPYTWTRDCAFGTDASGQCVRGLNIDYVPVDGRHPCALSTGDSHIACTNATATTGLGRLANMMIGWLEGDGTYNGTRYTFNTNATYSQWYLGTGAAPTTPSKGVYFMITTGTQAVPASNSPIWPHTAGVFYPIYWAAVEPGISSTGTASLACASATAPDNCFDWTDTVDNILNNLPDTTKTVQVKIDMGAYGSPMNLAPCTVRYNNTVIPNCSPWLANAGATGITVHSDQGPNKALGGYPAGTALIDPDPTNSVYQAAWKGLVNGFERKYHGNSQIALVSITPSSGNGGNLSLMVDASPPCPPPNGTQSCTEYYGTAWANESHQTTKQGWEDYLTPGHPVNFNGGMYPLWTYEKNTFFDQNIALWYVPNAFPDITLNNGAVDPIPRDNFFAYANNNQPSNGSYSIVNEALQASPSWINAVSHDNGINGSATTTNLGAQMARSFIDVAPPAGCGGSKPQDLNPTCIASACSVLRSAAITYGSQNGCVWEQIYNPDMVNCSTDTITCTTDGGARESSLACIAHALGTP